MSSPIPYLGSKICLISKSEIRYEGILYTIDAQESIIALAKVRSFGTEDRPTDMPVPARDDVFEYIIFRGTDIKKIEVCEAPKQPPSSIHNDPAIVQASAFGNNIRQPLGPIGGGAPGGFSQGGPQYGQSMGQQGLPGGPGFAGAAPGPAAGGVVLPGPSSHQSHASELVAGVTGTVGVQPGTIGSVLPNPIGHPPSVQSTPSLHLQKILTEVSHKGVTEGGRRILNECGVNAALSSGGVAEMMSGSRSPTPTQVSARKSPVSDAGVQVSSPPQQGGDNSRKGRGGGGVNNENRMQQRDSGMRRSNYGTNQGYNNQGYGNQGGYNQGGYSQGYNNQGQGYNNQGQGYNNQGQGYNNQGQGYNNPGQGYNNPGQGYNNQNSYPNQGQQAFRNNYNNQFYGGYQGRGGINRGNMGGNRGGNMGGMNRRGGRGGMGGGRGGMFVSNSRQREDKRLFEKDYDFEQANTQFEELRVKLSNTKISTGASSTGENESSDEKKEESSAPTTEGGIDSVTEDSEDSALFYDKAKSFFDNISCEAVERSQGRSQRPDWRRERKINQETFGVSAPRRGGFYGGGRGGFYNNRGGGYMRGGYNQGYNRGGYRGRGGYNNSRGGNKNNQNRNDEATNGSGTNDGGASTAAALTKDISGGDSATRQQLPQQQSVAA